jgi:ABC-type uncharacterized transport system ATPase component
MLNGHFWCEEFIVVLVGNNTGFITMLSLICGRWKSTGE